MSFADGNRVGIRMVQESSFGVTPASATWDALRIKSESLSHSKQTVMSEELRADRMRDDILEVQASGGGDFSFELSFQSFEKCFEALLQGTLTTVSTAEAGATFSSNEVTLSSGTVAALDVGQWFRLTDASTNTGIYRVASKPNGATVKVDSVFTYQGAVATTVLRAKGCYNGVTSRSFTLERIYEDIGKFFRLTGAKFNTGTLSVTSGAIVEGTFGLMGKEGTYASTTDASAVTSAPSTKVFTATANVGSIYEGSYASQLATALQEITLSITNNQREQNAIGNRSPVGIGEGSFEVTGTMNAYFENIVLAKKFVDHTSSALSFRFTDNLGNVMIITLPKIYYSEGNAPATGINTDVMLPLSFMAARDATTGIVMRIDFLAV